MKDFYVFICLVAIVFGILQIILFFKIWGMTNNVRKLTKHFCEHATNEESKLEQKYIPKISDDIKLGKYDHRLDNVNVGDKVRRKSDDKILEVVSIGEKVLECRGGMLDGIHSYPKDALSIV